MNLPVRFGWDAGSEFRLLCPGLPEAIVASDRSIAWVNSSGCWLWLDQAIWLYPVVDLQGVGLTTDSCVLLSGASPQFEVRVVDPATGTLVSKNSYECRSIHVGAELVVLDKGVERTVYDIRTGVQEPVPVGARDSRPQAWTKGRGIVWVDQLQVYRLRSGARPRMIGRLPSAPECWVVGPYGAALFSCSDSQIALLPNGTMKEMPPCDLGTVRFNGDGTEVLIGAAGGTAHVDLASGTIRAHRQGTLVPVGFMDGPVVFDEDAGLLKHLGGSSICDGFSPSAVAVFGDRIYGPGGTAWDLATGNRLWKDAPLCGLFLAPHADGVFQIADRIVGLNRDGGRVLDVPLPIDEAVDGEILDVRWTGALLEFELEEECVYVDTMGQRMNVEDHGLTSEPIGEDFEEAQCPTLAAVPTLLVDGHLQGPTTTWLWNEDGMLIRVQNDAMT